MSYQIFNITHPNGLWWIVESKETLDGPSEFELIHLPTRNEGGCGSQGVFSSMFEAQMESALIELGRKELA